MTPAASGMEEGVKGDVASGVVLTLLGVFIISEALHPGLSREAVAYWESVFDRLVKTDGWRKYLAESQSAARRAARNLQGRRHQDGEIARSSPYPRVEARVKQVTAFAERFRLLRYSPLLYQVVWTTGHPR